MLLRMENMFTAVVLWLLVYSTTAQQLLYRLTEVVEAGNYTYVKLTRQGQFLVILDTLSGDADLYVSEHPLSQPDFEHYDFKSATCGRDEVIVNRRMQRPVTIGVYGYSAEEVSSFELTVYVLSDEEGLESTEDYDDYSSHATMSQKQEKDEEPESALWAIIMGILKVMVDIML